MFTLLLQMMVLIKWYFSTVKLTLIFFKYFVCEECLWNYAKIPFLFEIIFHLFVHSWVHGFLYYAIGCNLLLALFIYLDAQIIV